MAFGETGYSGNWRSAESSTIVGEWFKSVSDPEIYGIRRSPIIAFYLTRRRLKYPLTVRTKFPIMTGSKGMRNTE